MKFDIEIKKNYNGFNLIIGINLMGSFYYAESLDRFVRDKGGFIKWNELRGLFLIKHFYDLLINKLNESLADKGYNLVCSADLKGIKIKQKD